MKLMQGSNSPVQNKLEDQKFLAFCLDKSDYGIPILKVNEIIGIVPITQTPKSPNYVKGVINLRGKIIPIIDLRLKLGMEEKKYDPSTCIIIINLEKDNETKQVGLVVDLVSEVCNIHASDIEEPPCYGIGIKSEILEGIGKIKNKVFMLLNIENIILSEEILNVFNQMETV